MCSVQGCDRPSRYKKLDVCGMHYQRIKLGVPLDKAPRRPEVRKTCEGPSCSRPSETWGLCHTHYAQAQRGQPLTEIRVYGRVGCRVLGCARPHEAHGYCTAHYARWRKTGDPISKRVRTWVVDGDVATCALFRGRVLVDAADVARVNGYMWVTRADGYVACAALGRMHRFILNAPANMQVDHINGDRADNRRANLRLVTHDQQMQNKKSWGSSGYRGVFATPHGRWRAVVRYQGKSYNGGRYLTREAAAIAARNLRAKLHTHAVEARHPIPE